MKVFNAIVKVVVALAAVAGAVYVVATYGEQIVAWAKRLWARLEDCHCCECEDCDCEDCDCQCDEQEETAAEDPAEEAVPAGEEAPADETAVVADEADFEG